MAGVVPSAPGTHVYGHYPHLVSGDPGPRSTLEPTHEKGYNRMGAISSIAFKNNQERQPMIRFVMTGLLVAAWMVPAHAEEKSKLKASSPAAAQSGGQASDSGHRVFELRTYYLNDGKLVDLHKRFREHTCDLLKKHGAELIGFWTPTDDKDGKGAKLIYLVAFPSREAAKKTWEDFGKDPDGAKSMQRATRTACSSRRWTPSSWSRPITAR